MGTLMVILLIIWVVGPTIPAFIADNKGRSGFGFFLLSLAFSPLNGLIAALIISPIDKESKTVVVTVPNPEKPLSEVSHIELLERLGQLKEKGLLTEAEYVSEKEKLKHPVVEKDATTTSVDFNSFGWPK